MFFSHAMIWTSSLLCLVAAAPAAVAAPPADALDKRWDNSERFWQHAEWHPSFIDFSRRQVINDAAGKCDLRTAQQPTTSQALPPPTKGYYLTHVAVGRGTQNYTCDLSNSTAVPIAAGAVAALFNVSCVAADQPALLSRLPGIALNLPVPSPADKTSVAYNDLSGHHYFTDATTAFFDLDTTLHDYGDGSFKKLNAVPAPSDASPGQGNKGDGAVPWLKLGAKAGTSQNMQEVYRLNTQGGNPPKTCAGAQSGFTVEYAAEYWFYSK